MTRTEAAPEGAEEVPEPTESVAALLDDVDWRVGAASGAIATVTMGIAISLTDVEMFATIAGLYGQAGHFVAGWLAHIVHGTIFGVIFAVALADPTLEDVPASHRRSIVAGVAFGLVLTVVGAGIILPIWALAVGLEGPAIPYVTAASFVWHLVYGVVLGAVFATLAD